jgi:hypothetical protein
MAGIPITYDPDTITAQEQAALHARRELFLNAFGNQPLFWTAAGSGAQREFQAYLYRDRTQPLGRVTTADLKKDNTLLRRDLAGRQ